MLRGAEMASIRFKDVKFMHKKAVVRLTSTKVLGYRRQDAELGIINNRYAFKWLRKVVSKSPKSDKPICGCSVNALRSHQKRAVKSLGLAEHGYSLHSWRRGSPTSDFLKHGQLDRTMLRGRWSSAKVCRDYISDATAALADAKLSSADKHRLLQYVGLVKRG